MIDLDEYQSVLFQQYGGFYGADLVSLDSVVSLESIVDRWIDTRDSTDPLILILDFALDVQQTLFAVSTNFDFAHWIDGEFLLNPNVSSVRTPGNSMVDLTEIPPAYLLIEK